MSRQVTLEAVNLSKTYGLRAIFSHINFALRTGDRLGITGRNGTGKSTLLKLLAGVAEHTSGEVRRSVDDVVLSDGQQTRHLGFVAPYLQLYNEFTAWEHVELLQQMRGLAFDKSRAQGLFTRFGLERRIHDELNTFSSGMLQRVKYICALIHSPAILLLDEPMSNFDDDGVRTVREVIAEHSPNAVIVIATNDDADLSLTTHTLSVESTAFAAALD
ncbi:MAG: ABC transporter ATP-binding protein [bacterium]|nr:ABC transporter ATP-binding protein [Candidatus Kapabacteria bacterium]